MLIILIDTTNRKQQIIFVFVHSTYFFNDAYCSNNNECLYVLLIKLPSSHFILMYISVHNRP